MAVFKIQIEVLLKKVVEIEAETQLEAFKKTENDIKAGKIELTDENAREFRYGIIE